MSWVLVFGGALAILDVFDSKTDTFTQRQDWQLAIGLVCIILGVIVYVWRDHDED